MHPEPGVRGPPTPPVEVLVVGAATAKVAQIYGDALAAPDSRLGALTVCNAPGSAGGCIQRAPVPARRNPRPASSVPIRLPNRVPTLLEEPER